MDLQQGKGQPCSGSRVHTLDELLLKESPRGQLSHVTRGLYSPS